MHTEQARMQDFVKGDNYRNTSKTTPTLNDHTHSHMIVACTLIKLVYKEQHIYTNQNKRLNMHLVQFLGCKQQTFLYINYLIKIKLRSDRFGACKMLLNI